MQRPKHLRRLRKKMIKAPVMRILNFSKVFKVECDAFDIGIGSVLSQERHYVAYFSEKLNETKKKDIPLIIRNSMQFFKHCAFEDIIYLCMNLSFTQIMKCCVISTPKKS